MDTGILILVIAVVVLLLWVLYQIARIQNHNDKLLQRVERLHAKINSMRRAAATEQPLRDGKNSDMHPASDAAEVARQH